MKIPVACALAALMLAPGCVSEREGLRAVDGGGSRGDGAVSLVDAAVLGPDSSVGQSDARVGQSDSGIGSSDARGPVTECPVPGVAIVSDIDETLTTADGEWLWQMLFGDHDPAMRPGGPELLHSYADRGYFILYLTSRPETTTLGLTGEPAYDATWRWLTEHGFPVDPARTRLQLAPDVVVGDSSAEYKGGALLDMQAEGFTFAAAYGNATSDITAYETAGIPKDKTFIIGANAGMSSTVAISGEGWEEHVASYIPSVEQACQ